MPISIETEHAAMVKMLVKSGAAILQQLNPSKVNMVHAVLGISGEAGELLDAIKKHAVYNKPLDKHNVVEELGDLEFYLAQLRQELGITREDTLEHNMDKLAVRYRNFQYSDEAAQLRADKKES